jgi:hypothetical protein
MGASIDELASRARAIPNRGTKERHHRLRDVRRVGEPPGSLCALQRHRLVATTRAQCLQPPGSSISSDTDIEMWEAAQDTFRACFPKLSGYTVKQANNETFLSRKKEQAKFKLSLSGVNSKDASRFESALLGFVTFTSRRPLQHENSTITLPFIHSTAMSSLDFVMDRYVDDIRDLFQLDQAKAACCSLKPDPDETVFVSDTSVLFFQRRPLKLSHGEA